MRRASSGGDGGGGSLSTAAAGSISIIHAVPLGNSIGPGVTRRERAPGHLCGVYGKNTRILRCARHWLVVKIFTNAERPPGRREREEEEGEVGMSPGRERCTKRRAARGQRNVNVLHPRRFNFVVLWKDRADRAILRGRERGGKERHSHLSRWAKEQRVTRAENYERTVILRRALRVYARRAVGIKQ